MTDFEKLAITTLAGLGTDRGAALAMEIERGRARREHQATLTPEQHEAEFKRRCADEDAALAEMLPHLRPATADDYHAWLLIHLAHGGQISHHYDFPFSGDRWYVATEPFTVQPLHGATSIQIIVPARVAVTVMHLGHNDIFWWTPEVGTRSATRWVPAFADSPGR